MINIKSDGNRTLFQRSAPRDLILLQYLIDVLTYLLTYLLTGMRTPTNALLVAMAVSDTMTGMSPIPVYLYFYTWGRCQDYVPYLPVQYVPVLCALSTCTSTRGADIKTTCHITGASSTSASENICPPSFTRRPCGLL